MPSLRLAGNVPVENWSHEVRLPSGLTMLLVLLVGVLLVGVLLVGVLLVGVVLVGWFCQVGVEFSSTIIESVNHVLSGDTFDTFISC